MAFAFDEARALLAQTPVTLRALLGDLPDGWLAATEGDGTWSPRDVLAHLADLEDTDWPVRADIIVTQGTTRPFPPIDRERFRAALSGESIAELLDAFAARRARNIAHVTALVAQPGSLALRGSHPEFGDVTLEQLLATWVVHDLTHIAQIARVMAKRYDVDVGPWRAYLGVLSRS